MGGEEVRIDRIIKQELDQKNSFLDCAISEYMINNNLSIEDIQKYGKCIIQISSGKTVYAYKNDVVCTIEPT